MNDNSAMGLISSLYDENRRLRQAVEVNNEVATRAIEALRSGDRDSFEKWLSTKISGVVSVS